MKARVPAAQYFNPLLDMALFTLWRRRGGARVVRRVRVCAAGRTSGRIGRTCIAVYGLGYDEVLAASVLGPHYCRTSRTIRPAPPGGSSGAGTRHVDVRGRSGKRARFDEWTAGILGDKPRPALTHAETTGNDERSRMASGSDDGEADARREASAGSATTTGASEARQHSNETLKRLDETWAVSSGVKSQDGQPQGGDYEASIEALEQRRAEYEAELRERVAAVPPAQGQETADSPARDTGVRMVHPNDEPEPVDPRMEANTGESPEPVVDRCKTTHGQGSVCVGYTLHDPNDCTKFSVRCQDSPGVTFERGHSCAPGLACRQRAPQRVSSTYDPSPDSGRLEALCVENQGKS